MTRSRRIGDVVRDGGPGRALLGDRFDECGSSVEVAVVIRREQQRGPS